jgi:hypothetical protein
MFVASSSASRLRDLRNEGCGEVCLAQQDIRQNLQSVCALLCAELGHDLECSTDRLLLESHEMVMFPRNLKNFLPGAAVPLIGTRVRSDCAG